jgi:hypothetical protein
MRKSNSVKTVSLLITGLLMLIFPVYIQIIQMQFSFMTGIPSDSEKSQYLIEHLPYFMQNDKTCLLIAFLFCLISFIISGQTLKKIVNDFKWLAYFNIVIGALTGFFCLYQMM